MNFLLLELLPSLELLLVSLCIPEEGSLQENLRAVESVPDEALRLLAIHDIDVFVTQLLVVQVVSFR